MGLLMVGGLSAIALGGSMSSASAGRALTGLLFALCVTAIAVSPLGRRSGAHINPAVTVAFRAAGRLCWLDTAGYIGAQLAGAVVGSLVFRALWGPGLDGGVTHSTVSVPLALGLETGMTAALVATIFVFNAHERLAAWTPLAIVPVITVLVWAGGPSTGTSLNPARSEGPAVAFGDLSELWLYFVAPIVGALAVAFVAALGRWRPMTASACSGALGLP